MTITSHTVEPGIVAVTVDYPPVNAIPSQGWFDLADTITAAGRDMELFLGSTSRTAAVLKLTAAISIKRPTECMVCMEALRNVRFACGHLACCEKCTAECAVGLSIPRACSLNAAYRLRGS